MAMDRFNIYTLLICLLTLTAGIISSEMTTTLILLTFGIVSNIAVKICEPKTAQKEVNFDILLPLLLMALLLATISCLLKSFLGHFDLMGISPSALNNIPKSVWGHGYSSMIIYNKDHVVSFVETLILLTVVFAIFLRTLEVKTSLAGVLATWTIFLTSIALPPYTFDFVHWISWLAPVGRILHQSELPGFSYASPYGIGAMLSVASWAKLFGVSQLSVACLSMLLLATSGTLSFIAVRQLSGDRLLSLLVMATLMFYFSDITVHILWPNLGAIRSLFMITATQYLALRVMKKPSAPLGIALGLIILWDPLFQLPVLITLGFVAILDRYSKNDSYLYKNLRWTVLGILVSISIALLCYRPSYAEIVKSYEQSNEFVALFRAGYGNAPQGFMLSFILVAILFLTSISSIFRVFWERRALSVCERFGLIMLGIAMPWLFYHLARGASENFSPIPWIAIPYIAVLFREKVKKIEGLTQYSTIILCSVFVILYPPIPAIIQKINKLTNHLEPERYRWSEDCDTKIANGQQCLFDSWPSIHSEVPKSFLPILEVDCSGKASSDNCRLAEACKQNVKIFSLVDGLIYLYSPCRPQSRLLSSLFIPTSEVTIANYIKESKHKNKLLFDTREHGQMFLRKPLDSLLDNLKNRAGFKFAKPCGESLVLLSRNEETEVDHFCATS